MSGRLSETALVIKLPDMGSSDIQVSMNRESTILEIKRKIKEKTKIPTYQQILLCNGTELRDTDKIFPNYMNKSLDCKFIGIQRKTKKSPIYIKINDTGEGPYIVKAFRIVDIGYLVNSCGNIIISDFSRSYIIQPNKSYAFDVFYMLPDQTRVKNFILSVYTQDGKYIKPDQYEWIADYDPNTMDITDITHLHTMDVKCFRFPDEEFFDPNRISVAHLTDLSKDTTKHVTFRLVPEHLSSIVHDWFSGTQLTDSLYDYALAFNPNLKGIDFRLRDEAGTEIPRNCLILKVESFSNSKEVTLIVDDGREFNGKSSKSK